jgi:hypothetical protein
MGGPWKERGFDPVAWRPPTPRPAISTPSADLAPDAGALGRLVLGCLVVVVTLSAVLLAWLRFGW